MFFYFKFVEIQLQLSPLTIKLLHKVLLFNGWNLRKLQERNIPICSLSARLIYLLNHLFFYPSSQPSIHPIDIINGIVFRLFMRAVFSLVKILHQLRALIQLKYLSIKRDSLTIVIIDKSA